MILQVLETIAIIAVTFLVLVAPHEGGHFAAAKLCRMRVIEFSIGMGPRLLSFLKGRTLYALRALPIGGFVRIGGMEPGDFSDPNGFHAKPAYQRVVVLVAGPLVNFVVASLIVTALLLSQVGGGIRAVTAGSPADRAGIRPGDKIAAVNGTQLSSSDQLRSIEQGNHSQPLDLTVKHSDGSVSHVPVQPTYDKSQHAYVIGVVSEQITVTDALTHGLLFPLTTIQGIGAGTYMLVTGQIPGGPFGPEGFTGPSGIAYISNQAAQQGPITWLQLVALLSVALGFFNLLPIPALDGGRIVVVLAEKLRGRPFDRDREMMVQRYGLAALLTLVAVISYFDLQRILHHQFPSLH